MSQSNRLACFRTSLLSLTKVMPNRGMEDDHIASPGAHYPSSAKGVFHIMTCCNGNRFLRVPQREL